jgi:hypothetical protein
MLALATATAACGHVTFEDRLVGIDRAEADPKTVVPQFKASIRNGSRRPLELPGASVGLLAVDEVRCNDKDVAPVKGVSTLERAVATLRGQTRTTVAPGQTLDFTHDLTDYRVGPDGFRASVRSFEVRPGMRCRARFSYLLPTGERITSNRVSFDVQ